MSRNAVLAAPDDRRGFLSKSAALAATITASALPPAQAVASTSSDLLLRIGETEQRCLSARDAFAAAVEAFEAALPPPHPSIDFTNRRGQLTFAAVERREFDGVAPNRAIVKGRPALRWVCTSHIISNHLCACYTKRARKLFRKMLARAAQREAETLRLEQAFGLANLWGATHEAERGMNELAKIVFAEPATDMASAMIQARMITAYANGIDAGYAEAQAGRYGRQLAASLQKIGAAA